MRRLLYAVLLLVLGCESKAPAPPRPEPAPATTASPRVAPPAASIRSRYPAARRVVAIGDVHGDLSATLAALRLAGVIDAQGKWSGGDAVLVQTGDILDRGDHERAIVELFERLEGEARAAGGAVHVLNGNHELMNAAGDMRYVTQGGWRDFESLPGMDVGHPGLARVPPERRPRYAAMLPGGVYARTFAAHPVVLVIGDTVFAHGGVLPKWAKYGIERLNREVGAWLLGRSELGRQVVASDDSPVWSRHYSDEPDEDDCRLLAEALATLGVKRMVVGHTVQQTIRPACDARVWRIDVGMSAHYGGHAEALQIQAGAVEALRQKSR